MFPLVRPLSRTVHSSALLSRSAFSRIARAWRSSRIMSDLPRGVDDVDARDVRRARPVRDGARLARLALAVVERPAHPVVPLVADGGARVPEFLRIGLVGHVPEHPGDLSVQDLVEELAAELEVV